MKKLYILGTLALANAAAFAQSTIPDLADFEGHVTNADTLFGKIAVVVLAIVGFGIMVRMLRKVR